jgi:hypothetical protein
VSHVDNDDRALLRQLLDGTVDASHFGHAQHVRAAWALLEDVGLERAVSVYPAAIQRLAAHHGAPQRYHATVTLAYLFLIDERRRVAAHASWAEFAAANADLLTWSPSILDRYYTRERLWSADARSFFVLPDRTHGQV